MNSTKTKFSGLTGNQLKIIALIAMTLDHIAVQLLPQIRLFRIIGRLAFPIFAFMIAEGCRYTKNRKKYLGSMALLALACQIVYYIAAGSLYMCVLVTFSLSIVLIYVLDYAISKRTAPSVFAAIIAFSAVYIICEILPYLLGSTDFYVDYGFWGVMLPAAVFLGKTRLKQLSLACIALGFLCISIQGIQWFSFLALILLAMYNGQRGRLKMKYLFYVYYPLHLAVIYAIGAVIYHY